MFQDLSDGRPIRLIQCISWPDHGVPDKSNVVLALLTEVETSQRAAGKGPVTVVCRYITLVFHTYSSCFMTHSSCFTHIPRFSHISLVFHTCSSCFTHIPRVSHIFLVFHTYSLCFTHIPLALFQKNEVASLWTLILHILY